VAELRHIANSCEFTGDQASVHLECALSEAIVQNIREERIKKELITVDNLTFDTVVSTALKF
jgi:hypothetical protein